MTNELEKQFFDTFGIEPKKGCTAYDKFTEEEADLICNDKCVECSYLDDVYPQITSDRLLKLICMANQHEDYPISTNIKNIQARTLRILLRAEKFYKNYYGSDGRYKKLVKQVRTLFEEEIFTK